VLYVEREMEGIGMIETQGGGSEKKRCRFQTNKKTDASVASQVFVTAE